MRDLQSRKRERRLRSLCVLEKIEVEVKREETHMLMWSSGRDSLLCFFVSLHSLAVAGSHIQEGR